MEEEEKKHCPVTGKRMFSLGEARAAIAGFRSRRLKHGGMIPKRIYKCRFCGSWHLTHFSRKR